MISSQYCSGKERPETPLYAGTEQREEINAADDGFDPNFVTRKHESVKLSIPFFKQFWEQGN
ncbi:Exc2 family lipoprotein [Serratia marcescens]|nr:Exc2 family lipoprotein [Serratia marcescens]